jgi:hypothetical protein
MSTVDYAKGLSGNRSLNLKQNGQALLEMRKNEQFLQITDKKEK